MSQLGGMVQGAGEDAKAVAKLPEQLEVKPFDQQEPTRNMGVMATMPYLVGLAALGGKAAGLHAKTMLGGINGIVQGIRQGNEQAFADSKKKYDDAYQRWLQEFTQKNKLYQSALQFYAGRTDAQMKALQFAINATEKQQRDMTTDEFKRWKQEQDYAVKLQELQQKIDYQGAYLQIMKEKADRTSQGGAGGMGSREAVFLSRIISAGNEAAAAAQNIMDLPIASSKGIFGSAVPDHGLLDSAKGVLANKVTSQEAQTYKVMIAGVRRNLAAIEASGLAPSGALSEQMSAVEIQEGDTQITKLRRMAELRQIVEKGLEPSLANPRVPAEQKELVQKIIDQMQAAIPFTQQDVTKLEQSKNPELTIRDVASHSGVSAPKAAVTLAPYDDPEKEARYQAWKKANGK